MPSIPKSFTIETERSRLRAPEARDISSVLSATRFEGFNDGMRWDPPQSEAELYGPLQDSLQRWAEGVAFTFTIERKHDSAFLGRISIRPTATERVWDIGFWLHPEHQGNGYMLEAAKAVLTFGFGVLEAEAVQACYATWNQKSRRVLDALGMRQVDFVPQGLQKRGGWVPEYRMQIDKQEGMKTTQPDGEGHRL